MYRSISSASNTLQAPYSNVLLHKETRGHISAGLLQSKNQLSSPPSTENEIIALESEPHIQPNKSDDRGACECLRQSLLDLENQIKSAENLFQIVEEHDTQSIYIRLYIDAFDRNIFKIRQRLDLYKVNFDTPNALSSQNLQDQSFRQVRSKLEERAGALREKLRAIQNADPQLQVEISTPEAMLQDVVQKTKDQIQFLVENAHSVPHNSLAQLRQRSLILDEQLLELNSLYVQANNSENTCHELLDKALELTKIGAAVQMNLQYSSYSLSSLISKSVIEGI